MKIIKVFFASAVVCLLTVQAPAMVLRSGKNCNQGLKQAAIEKIEIIIQNLEELVARVEENEIIITAECLEIFSEIKDELNQIEGINTQDNFNLDNQIIDAHAMLYVLSTVIVQDSAEQLLTESAMQFDQNSPLVPQLLHAQILKETQDSSGLVTMEYELCKNKKPTFLPNKLHRSNAMIGQELADNFANKPSTGLWKRIKEVARYLCCCRKRISQN